MDETEAGPEIVLLADDPPESGIWVETCDVLANPTFEEMNIGRALGERIDPENDESGTADE